MCAPLNIQLNGQPHTFSDPELPINLASVIEALNLKADRIAVELNGNIIARADWITTSIAEDDRLEIVHFVGGGASSDSCGRKMRSSMRDASHKLVQP